MSHLARAAAALGALALVVPGVAGAAAKPKHTTTVKTVSALPKTTPKNLSRKCGKSKSAKKIRTRRTSHPTKQRIRTITTYCNGGTRTAFTILRPAPKVITNTVTVPAPVVASAKPAPSTFRLTLLHNNDGESKYVVGDSIANYGGITRFKTVLDRLRAEADSYTNFAEPAGLESKGTVTISSGDNFLAGLNLRASFQRYDAHQGPWYDSEAINAIGYDATTIGNHEYDFGPGPPGAVHHRGRQDAVPDRQHGLQRASRRCRRCATAGGSRTRSSSRRAARRSASSASRRLRRRRSPRRAASSSSTSPAPRPPSTPRRRS